MAPVYCRLVPTQYSTSVRTHADQKGDRGAERTVSDIPAIASLLVGGQKLDWHLPPRLCSLGLPQSLPRATTTTRLSWLWILHHCYSKARARSRRTSTSCSSARRGQGLLWVVSQSASPPSPVNNTGLPECTWKPSVTLHAAGLLSGHIVPAGPALLSHDLRSPGGAPVAILANHSICEAAPAPWACNRHGQCCSPLYR